MRIVQATNKVLWYVVDDDNKICKIAWSKEQAIKYLKDKK